MEYYYWKLREIESLTFDGKMSGIKRCRYEQELYKNAIEEGMTAKVFVELSRQAYHCEKSKFSPVFLACSD